MKRCLLLFLLIITLSPVAVYPQFEGAALGARSQAMGGSFVSLGDDASTLFVNPSALVTAETLVLYGEYGDAVEGGRPGEAKLDVLLPSRYAAFGAGWYHRGPHHGSSENLFVLGIARRILEGSEGSFFSVGMSLRLGRISHESSCACAGAGDSESEVTGDVGLVLRPLPVISFGYSIENLREAEFESNDTAWRRVHRWGISYFWEEKVVLSFEQEHRFDTVIRHYGFSVRTAVPLEVMAGLSKQRVTGGLRWIGDRLRVTLSFMAGDDGGIMTKAALEVFPYRGAGSGQ